MLYSTFIVNRRDIIGGGNITRPCYLMFLVEIVVNKSEKYFVQIK